MYRVSSASLSVFLTRHWSRACASVTGSDAAARAITAYNPDSTWTKVTPVK